MSASDDQGPQDNIKSTIIMDNNSTQQHTLQTNSTDTNANFNSENKINSSLAESNLIPAAQEHKQDPASADDKLLKSTEIRFKTSATSSSNENQPLRSPAPVEIKFGQSRKKVTIDVSLPTRASSEGDAPLRPSNAEQEEKKIDDDVSSSLKPLKKGFVMNVTLVETHDVKSGSSKQLNTHTSAKDSTLLALPMEAESDTSSSDEKLEGDSIGRWRTSTTATRPRRNSEGGELEVALQDVADETDEKIVASTVPEPRRALGDSEEKDENTILVPSAMDEEDEENNSTSLVEAVNLAKEYRKILEESPDIPEDQKIKLRFLAASCFIDDAWSRKSVNFNVLRDPNALQARSLQSMSKIRWGLALVLIVHMSLAFLEAPSTWTDSCYIPFDGRAQSYVIFIEAFCLIFYLLMFVIYGLVNGYSWARIVWMRWSQARGIKLEQKQYTLYQKFPKPKQEKSNRIYSAIHFLILILISTDLILKIGFSGRAAAAGRNPTKTYSFSRPLRSLLLILNFRRLRQMFGTILRMLPSTFLLILALFVLILVYSVIGVSAFWNLNYEGANASFSSSPQAFITMNVMLSSENYPDAIWSAYSYSAPFTLVYFISFLCIGGAILAAILGVIFDTYKRWVVRQAYRNLQKERIGLAAAFTLMAECPESFDGHKCRDFPCEHGAGVLSFKSWKKLFLYFSKHGKSSYVRGVFDRNIGLLGVNKSQIELLESEKMADNVNNVLLPPFWKMLRARKLTHKIGSNAFVLGIKKRKAASPVSGPVNKRASMFWKTRTAVFDSIGITSANDTDRIYWLSMDLGGFFKMCDQIRSRLEAPPDKPLLKVKKEFLALLDAIESCELNEDEDEDDKKGDSPGGQEAVPRIIQNQMKSLFKQETKMRYNNLLEAASNHDYPEFRRLFTLKYAKELDGFRSEFNRLTLRHRKHMRRYMLHKIKSFGEEFEGALDARGDFDVDKFKVNEFQVRYLNDIALPKLSEVWISKGRFIYSIYGCVFSFFLLQLILASKTLAFNRGLQALEFFLICIFILEILLYINGLGAACLRRIGFLLSSSLGMIAALSHFCLFAFGYKFGQAPSELDGIDWRYRVLRALTTLPLFRVFFILYAILEKKIFPNVSFLDEKKMKKKLEKQQETLKKTRKLASHSSEEQLGNLSMGTLVVGKSEDNLGNKNSPMNDSLNTLREVEERTPSPNRTPARGRDRGLIQAADLVQVRLKQIEQMEEKKEARTVKDDNLIDVEQSHNAIFEKVLRLRNLFVNLAKVLFLISIVVFCLTYTFAIVGMELFSCNGMESDPQGTEFTHFDTLVGSFFALIQIISSNNWHQVMYPVVVRSSEWSSIYFILYFTLITIIIMSLMAALVVEAFEDLHTENVSKKKKNKVKDLENKTTFELYERFVSTS